MKKKMLLIAAFISALFLMAIADAGFVKLAQANPYLSYDWVSPPDDAKPPKISIHPVRNNTVYALNNLSLTLNVSIPESNYPITIFEIRYKRDWKESTAYIYHRPLMAPGLWKTEYSYNVNLIEIPEGNHNVTFTVDATGGYAIGLAAYSFSVTSISMINFTIDTTPPSISALSVENKTYYTSDVPLTFMVNEPVSSVTCSLDGETKVLINGNATLTDLADGEHNVTVYARDIAGNIGTSETITFVIAKESQPEPFSTELAITASGASAAVVGIGLVVYFGKFKERTEKL